jgi:hypothetical protein
VPSDALVIAPTILAVVFLVSAWGKLRAPEASSQAFSTMRVPAPLSTPFVVRALPWVEVALALALVITSGALGVVAAAGAVALVAAYLWLVVRARGFEEDVDCACFGSLGASRVTRLTVVRNVWLLILSLVTFVLAVADGSVVSRVTDGRSPWWWLIAAAAAAATVVLIAGLPGTGAERADATSGELAVDEGDYVRMRTPALPIMLGDGSHANLRQLSQERAQLLLYVSEGCGSCQDVIAAVPNWREDLALLDIRFIVRQGPEASSLTSPSEPRSLHDTEGLLNQSFDMRATPSAILLGADGLVAGGPVIGRDPVMEFVDDIAAELRAAV